MADYSETAYEGCKRLDNGRYRINGIELEYSEGCLRGAVNGIRFAVPVGLVRLVLNRGEVRRTARLDFWEKEKEHASDKLPPNG